MGDSSGLMHVDWQRWFQKLSDRVDAGAIVYAETVLGGQPLTRVNDTNITATLTGTPLTALLKPVTITLGWTGTLSPARGGTGLGSYTVGDLLVANSTTTLASLPDVAVGSLLASGGVSTAPAWSTTPLLTGSLSIIPTIDPPAALLLQGDAANAAILVIHNSYALGADLYSHSNTGFRAPYINFYKSRGTQASPTPPTLTGYELDSVGGINFGGWNGSAYEPGAGLYSQVDQNWTASNRGAHLSIYGRNNFSVNIQQVMQFGGLDPTDAAALNAAGTTNNVLCYRPFVFSGNQSGNPGLFPSSSPAKISIRTSDNGGFAKLDTGSVIIAAGTTAAGTAPLKLTSGAVMTTPEAGAVEFLADVFFGTITTGAARKGLVMDDGARLTSGLMPVATTNGRLIDGPAFSAGVITANITGSSGSTTSSGITDDTTTNASMFPVWVTANSGSLPLKVSSTKLSFNPSNGLLSGIGLALSAGTARGLQISNTNSTSFAVMLNNTTFGTGDTKGFGIFQSNTGFAEMWNNNVQMLIFDPTGNIGFKVVPVARLDVGGSVRIRTASTANNLEFFSTTSNTVKWTYVIDSSDLSLYDPNVLRFTFQNGGRFGIGVASPTALIHFKAGTATASTAPLKFTSGTNLTTAEAGAMEYNGTNLFFTRAGTVRENVLVAIDNVAAPTTNAGTPTTRYGGDTNYLGDPNRWLSVNVLGSTYKIPLYN